MNSRQFSTVSAETALPPPPQLTAAMVTIVVLNWKRPHETLACLDSLQRATLDGAAVLVVDNGSHDGSVATIRAAQPSTPIVELDENRGYAGGNNAGIRAAMEAGAAAVLLLNNDTEVAPDFLSPLLDVLNANPRAAAAASAMMRADAPQLLEAAYLEVYFGHGLVHRRGVNALPSEGFDTVRAVDVSIGCSLLLRVAALRDVGLLDEAFFAYHEEVDWCHRARQRGHLVYFHPYSRVWHQGSRSTSALTADTPGVRTVADRDALPNATPLSWNPIRSYLGARNAIRFVRRHGSVLQRLYFVASSLYAVPLELLAVAERREEDLMLGRWTYRRALQLAGVRQLVRDVQHAHRDGRTAQIVAHLHGLWDGVLGRPLPLERLGLRTARTTP